MSNRLVALSLLAGIVVLGAAPALARQVRGADQQPHLYPALDALETARLELLHAPNDRNGNRARAIQLVNQAKTQVKLSLQRGHR